MTNCIFLFKLYLCADNKPIIPFIMDKASIKSSMLSAISEELDLWLEKESSINDVYQ